MPLPDADATAPSNPKELINAYLLSQGKQPTNALMSQALMANAQNPGLIPGLRNSDPVVSEGDPGFVGPSSKGGGGGGGGRRIAEGRTKDDRAPSIPRDARDDPTAPPAAAGSSGDLISSLLLGIPLIGGAAYGAKKYFDRPSPLREPGPPGETPRRVGEPAPTPLDNLPENTVRFTGGDTPPARGSVPEVPRGGAPAAATPPGEPNLPLRGGGGGVTGGAGDPMMEAAMQNALQERGTRLFGNRAPEALRTGGPDIGGMTPATNARNAAAIENKMWPQDAPPMVQPSPYSVDAIKDKLTDLLARGTKGLTPDVGGGRGVPRARAPRA